MNTQDPIERFLEDAEQAVRDEDRELALDLLVLALDTAPPDDPSVLIRAHAIRSTIPRHFSGTSRPEGDHHDSSSLFNLPEVDRPTGQREDEEDVSADEIPTILALPEISEVVLSGLAAKTVEEERQEEAEMYGPTSIENPSIANPFFDFDEDGGADEEDEEEEGPSRLMVTSVRFVLWPAILLLVAGAGLFYFNPGAFDTALRSVQQHWDVAVRAELAIERERYERAEAAADLLLSEGRDLPLANRVLGDVALAQGQVSMARRHYDRSLAAGGRWQDAMGMAEAMAEADELSHSADLYAEAWNLGAIWETWIHIANAQRRAGREAEAIRFYSFVRDRAPDGADVDGVLRDSLDAPPSPEPEPREEIYPDADQGPEAVGTEPDTLVPPPDSVLTPSV